jgi:hypothetical protein
MSTSEIDDGKELREYMESEMRGLRPDRSTYSYALEFLKTERHNRRIAEARADVATALGNIKATFEMAERSLADCRAWSDKATTRLEKLING